MSLMWTHTLVQTAPSSTDLFLLSNTSLFYADRLGKYEIKQTPILFEEFILGTLRRCLQNGDWQVIYACGSNVRHKESSSEMHRLVGVSHFLQF